MNSKAQTRVEQIKDWISINDYGMPTKIGLYELAWFPNGELEHGPKKAVFNGSEFEGGWTPTHYRVRQHNEARK